MGVVKGMHTHHWEVREAVGTIMSSSDNNAKEENEEPIG